MKFQGVLHINRIQLDKIHRLTLKKLADLGFLANWVNTPSIPEVQVFKSDVEDSNYITVIIRPDLLDVQTSFERLKLNTKEGDELRTTFHPAVALIDKIFHKDSMDLDATDDYEFKLDNSV